MSTELHNQLIETAVAMNTCGINRGRSGNLSVRTDAGFLITPSGMDYQELLPEDIVAMNFEGEWQGSNAPSSEWWIHRDIYREREDALVIRRSGVGPAHVQRILLNLLNKTSRATAESPL
jgi:ribulose-5-phosphate 4-epimerase/fuculose-1-phosphate aldolase